MITPVDLNKFTLTSPFGNRPSLGDFHAGVDWAPINRQPSEFFCPQDGTVIFVGLSKPFIWRKKTYQNPTIIIRHDSVTTTVYAHWTKSFVVTGQKVKQGQVLGLTGNEGASLGNHLHFEIRIREIAVDPVQYIKNQMNNESNTIIVQPGWGISHVAKNAGYPDFSSEERWNFLAKINGFNSWKEMKLVTGQILKIREEKNVVQPNLSLDVLVAQFKSDLQKEKEELEKIKIETQNLAQKTIEEKISLQQSIQDLQKKINESNIIKEEEVVTEAKNTDKINLDSLGKLSEWEFRFLTKTFQDLPLWIQIRAWWSSQPSWFKNFVTVLIAIFSGIIIEYFSQTMLPDLNLPFGVISGATLTSIFISFLKITKEKAVEYVNNNVS